MGGENVCEHHRAFLKLRRCSHGQCAAPFEGSLISERLSMLDESFTFVKLHLSTHVSVCSFVAQPLSVSVQMRSSHDVVLMANKANQRICNPPRMRRTAA